MKQNLSSIPCSACEMLVSVLVAALRSTQAVGQHGSVVGAAVTRTGSSFQINWTTAGWVNKVKIFEGISPDQIENLVVEPAGVTVVTVTGLDPNSRHYFRVKGGSGNGVIVAERGVPQIGVLNFRDVGGYSTVRNNDGNGKQVRWGMFFRSGAPNAQSNQSFLTVLGVRTVIDVRSGPEITAVAPRWSASGVNVISSPIFDQGGGI